MAKEAKKVIAVLVASLISQALLFLPLSPPLTPTNPSQLSQFLLLHLISTSQLTAATTTYLQIKNNNKNKRKRQHHQQQQQEQTREQIGPISSPSPNPDHFPLSFRMSSSTFDWLSGLLDPLLDCRDPSGSSLHLASPTRLAIALSRLATGAPYPDIARRFSVSEQAARFCTNRLCRVLCTNFRFWLSFNPSFRVASLIPGCCGAIACARFDVGDGRTVAAQIVADASSKILSIAAGFRGDRTDADIMKNSSLCKDVEMGRLLGSGQYLVGGVGYPLLSWLVVPFRDVVGGSAEQEFNAVHGMMCRPVYRAVSSLRSWGVMSRLMEEDDGKMAVACIGTCALLHNVLLMREEESSAVSLDVAADVEKYSGDDKMHGVEQEGCADEKALAFRSNLAMNLKAVCDSA